MELKCTITVTGTTDSDQLGLNINFDPPLTTNDVDWDGTPACAFAGEVIKRIHELMPEKEDDDDENN